MMTVTIYKGYGFQVYFNVIRIANDKLNKAIKITQKIYKHEIIKFIKYEDIDYMKVKVG